MDVRRPERLFPVVRAVLANVAEQLRARGHALLELRRKAGERVRRHAERLQALVGERNGDPGVRPAGWTMTGRNRPRAGDAAAFLAQPVGHRYG